MAAVKKASKKKDVKIVSGILSVKTTDNNTMIVLTDKEWNKVLWWGTWLLWYKWAKKKYSICCRNAYKKYLERCSRFVIERYLNYI